VPSLPEGYTVTVTFDGDDKPCYAELRDSGQGMHVADALWFEQFGMWYDPSGHGFGANEEARDKPIAVATTLKVWLEERGLRGDRPCVFAHKEE
jgi:hypothetical protein